MAFGELLEEFIIFVFCERKLIWWFYVKLKIIWDSAATLSKKNRYCSSNPERIVSNNLDLLKKPQYDNSLLFPLFQ